MAYGGAITLSRGAKPAKPSPPPRAGRAGRGLLPSGGAGLTGAAPQPNYAPFTAGANRPPAPRPAGGGQHAQQNKNRQAAAAKARATVDPLAPLQPGQIRSQATQTINKAYGGAFTNLDQQSTQAQNLYHTQQSDDAAYNQWLTSNAQAMQAQTDTVNQKLTDILTNMRTQQGTLLNAIPGNQAANQATPGGAISQGQIGQTLQREEAPFIGGAEQHANEEGIQQATASLAGNTLAVGSAQVGQARMEQARTQQFDVLNKTLNSIANERAKLLTARTGDIAKEIARLNGIEISKAQFKVNQANLATATGIKQQAVDVSKQNANTAAKNATTNALRAKETALHNANMEKITSTHYANADARAKAVEAERARHNAAAEAISQQNANTRATAGGPGAKPKLTNTQRSQVSGYIETIRNALIDDINRYHRGQTNALSLAYHDITSGRYHKATGQGIGAPPLGADKFSYLNAAINTLTQYGATGLSPGDVAFLNSIGYGTGSYPVKMQNKGTNPRQDASGQTIGQ